MRWISVKDKLPSYELLVLVYSENYEVGLAYLDGDGKWYGDFNDVAYWMPLPKPPEDCDNDSEDIEHTPVIHANWILIQNVGFFHNRVVKCSHCGNFLDIDGVNAGRGNANFCPNCGAKMDEEEGRK